jgi:hypothetical protein
MHDVRDPADLLRDEYEQRQLSGYDVAHPADAVARVRVRPCDARLR